MLLVTFHTFLSALVSAFNENEFVLKREANFMSSLFTSSGGGNMKEKNQKIHHIIASHFY